MPEVRPECESCPGCSKCGWWLSKRLSELRSIGLVNPEPAIARHKTQKTCESCGAAAKRLVIDHDHATGLFRGILCHPCNAMLGLARDRPEVLRAGAAYLERTAEEHAVDPLAEPRSLEEQRQLAKDLFEASRPERKDPLEDRVLALKAEGLTTAQTAAELGISYDQVRYRLDKHRPKRPALAPQIIELRKQGLTHVEIAERVGCHKGTVQRLVAKHLPGFKLCPVAEIRALRQQGLSYEGIAAKTGVCAATAYNVINGRRPRKAS